MASGDIFDSKDSRIINILPPEPDVIIFNCEKLVISPNQVLTEWPDGFSIEFDKYQRFVFTNGKTRVTYSKIRTEHLE